MTKQNELKDASQQLDSAQTSLKQQRKQIEDELEGVIQ